MLEKIKKDIINAVSGAGLKISSDDIMYPENSALGDIAVPVFRFAKELGKSPIEIARSITLALKKKKTPSVSRVEAVNGYVNFFLDTTALARYLFVKVIKDDTAFGDATSKTKKQKVIVEFVQPNTNKPLHLGHLRNATLGEAVARLLENQGFKVVRTNLVNDRGAHICKSMVAYERFGKVPGDRGEIFDSPVVSGMKGDHFVGKYYVIYDREVKNDPSLEKAMHDCLLEWESGDTNTMKLWKTMREWVLQGFEESYKVFGIHFDRVDYESNIWKDGKTIVLKGLKDKIFKLGQDGSIFAFLEKFNLPNKILLRKDGTSIYITTDLAVAYKRYKEEKYDQLIYVVGSEQDLYFKQLFAVFQLLKVPYAAKTHHLSYGMVFLPEGKMKSREGTAVDADDLIAKLQDYAAEEIKARHDFLPPKEVGRRSQIIALAALKYYLLAVNPPKAMHFNPKESISFTGKTGPYLLYTLARMKSILHKSTRTQEHRNRETKEQRNRETEKQDNIGDYLQEKEEHVLIIEMAKFPEALRRGAETFDPEEVATYLYNLAKKFSDFYEKHSVLDAEPEIREARLALVEALSIVMEKGLNTLGIETLDEM